MSSSGIIGKVGGSSITGIGEDMRRADSAIQGQPSNHEQTRQLIGIVDSVDTTLARWVTAHEPTGKTILSGRWIELSHSAREIAERWGTVPIGATLRVTLLGPGDGVSASATIVDTEGKGANEPIYANEATQGLFALFAPGSTG